MILNTVNNELILKNAATLQVLSKVGRFLYYQDFLMDFQQCKDKVDSKM